MNKLLRDLSNTPFSYDRLIVWAVGFTLVLGTIGIIVIAYQGHTIPPQLQSVVMVSLGAFVAKIERKK